MRHRTEQSGSESNHPHRGERRKFHFDRSICLGDMVGVLTLVGDGGGGIWFAAQQSAKIDEVTLREAVTQGNVETLKTDVATIKAEVHDMHDWIKR